MQAQMVVQSLQGTRAQIMLAFLFAGHAMDVEELMNWTGRDRKTHYGHLGALCSVGLLAKQTAAHGRDVYLPGSEMLPALRSWAAQLEDGGLALESGVSAFQMSEKRTPGKGIVVVGNSELDLPTITTTTTTITQVSEKRTPAERNALNAVLNEFHIVGKKRAQLIECEWVTAEYVRAHVDHAQSENHWDQPVGMAITRMLECASVPQKRVKQSRYYLCPECNQSPCSCDEEIR